MSRATLFNKYPPFVHGEARGEADEFIVHTRYPRFIARRSSDDGFTGALPVGRVAGEFGRNGKGHIFYNSGIGVWFSDFIFLDGRPDNEKAFAAALTEACDRAVADGLMLDDETQSGVYGDGF